MDQKFPYEPLVGVEQKEVRSFKRKRGVRTFCKNNVYLNHQLPTKKVMNFLQHDEKKTGGSKVYSSEESKPDQKGMFNV